MSYLDEAMNRMDERTREALKATLPFRAIVTGTDGNLTTIRRIGATTGGSQEYAKATSDTFSADDEVLVQPVLGGDYIILGEIRR